MGLLDRFRPPPPKKNDREVGRSGTVNTHGFLQSEELNANLQWPRCMDVWDEMRRTDPTCRWMLALLKTPIQAAEWNVEPPKNPSKEELELAGFVRQCLFEELDDGWDGFLTKALRFFDYGHSVLEGVTELREVWFTYTDENGDEQEVTREAFVYARLSERLQRTIQKWHPVPGDSSRLKSVEQWLYDSQGIGTVEIPAERLVVFTYEQEGDDWRGTSLLRAAYKSYLYKKQLENLEAIALERSAGLPVVYPPQDANEDELDEVEEAVRAMRQGENLYVIMPGPKQFAERGEGWLIEPFEVKGDGQRSPHDAIQRHEAAMARNVLAEFMRLGHEQTGARATGEVQQDPYYQAVEAVCKYLEKTVRHTVIRRLASWNYPEGLRLPKVTASKIQAKNIQVIFEALSKATANGLITTDLDTENWAREQLDAPPKELNEGEEDPHKKPDPVEPEPPERPDPQQPEPPGQKAAMSDRAYQPRNPVESVVAWSELAGTLDSAQEAVAVVARAEIERQMRGKVGKDLEAAVQHRSPDAVEALGFEEDAIRDRLTALFTSLHADGQSSVDRELAAQGKPVAMATAPLPAPHAERAKRIAAMAATVAASITAAAARALRALAMRRIEEPEAVPTGPGYDPVVAGGAEAKRAGTGTVSDLFNQGRTDRQRERQDEITYSVRSALLDNNTCEVCERRDGIGGPPGPLAPPGGFPDRPCPDPDCHGGGACRCVYIPVVDAMQVALPEAA